MKKQILLTQNLLGSFYIASMIGLALINNEGRFLALVMLFFLGVAQYTGALIWILAGDRRRRHYFLWASMYLALSIFGAYSGLTDRYEKYVIAGLLSMPVALAIWYQIIAYRHYHSMEDEQVVESHDLDDLL